MEVAIAARHEKRRRVVLVRSIDIDAIHGEKALDDFEVAFEGRAGKQCISARVQRI